MTFSVELICLVAPLLGATGGGGSSSTTGVTAGGGATGGITLEETWSEVAELLNDCISQVSNNAIVDETYLSQDSLEIFQKY